MADFELVDVEEMPYLYVERTCKMDPSEIGPAMGSGLGEVWGFMESHGIAPAGGALAVYHAYDPNVMTFRCGFIVNRADMDAATCAVKADVTPGGRVVHGRHKGSYSGIRGAYGEMHGFVTAAGLGFAAPTWEVYRNSPDEVAEDALLTDLYQALQP
jgi:effector-binding domain-containing protein